MEPWYDTSRFAENPAENYQAYFVPVIGRPIAAGLIEAANLRRRENVLDVACGTGVATRLAAERVGDDGSVTGLDVNPAMVTVARASTPADVTIEWVESPAEDMPFADGSFDVALCGMGLQFFEDRVAGLAEMRRVLADEGRAVLDLPGPIPGPFRIFERGLARHVGEDVAGFASLVFSLHEEPEIRDLCGRAGFEQVDVTVRTQSLTVPSPEEFLWQYIHATPLAGALAAAGEERRGALEADVCEGWRTYEDGGRMRFDVRMTTVVASG